MKKQIFYGITFYFENFNHQMDSDLLGEILRSRFMKNHGGQQYERRKLADWFKDCFPFIDTIVLYKVSGRKNEHEREFSVSEYIISKAYLK